MRENAGKVRESIRGLRGGLRSTVRKRSKKDKSGLPKGTLPALYPLLQDLVHDSVLFGLVGCEEIVTVVVTLDLLG